jgi:VanZ family protein
MVLLTIGIHVGGAQEGAGAIFMAPWDKVAHFCVFGAMALFAGIAWPRLSLLWVFLMVFAIGISDEVHQLFLAGRVAGWDDLAADALGVACALPIVMILRKKLSLT